MWFAGKIYLITNVCKTSLRPKYHHVTGTQGWLRENAENANFDYSPYGFVLQLHWFYLFWDYYGDIFGCSPRVPASKSLGNRNHSN